VSDRSSEIIQKRLCEIRFGPDQEQPGRHRQVSDESGEPSGHEAGDKSPTKADADTRPGYRVAVEIVGQQPHVRRIRGPGHQMKHRDQRDCHAQCEPYCNPQRALWKGANARTRTGDNEGSVGEGAMTIDPRLGATQRDDGSSERQLPPGAREAAFDLKPRTFEG